MSAAEYTCVSTHTEHTPGYVWPTSRCLCLSRALLLGWQPWRQKSSVKTDYPSRETFWSWGRGMEKDHRRGRRALEAGKVGRQAATGNQSVGSTELHGWDWSKGRGPLGTAVTAGQTEDGCGDMGRTRTVWTREKNWKLKEVEGNAVGLEEQGLLMAEGCSGDPVWTRPMTVCGLLAQPPRFLLSPGSGFPRDLNITDTNCTTRSSVTAGESLPRCKQDHRWMLFQTVESQNCRTAQVGRNLERSSTSTFHRKWSLDEII